MSIRVWLVLLAVLLSGCTGGSPRQLDIQVYNRSPEDLVLELVPEGMSDPKLSPMYQTVEVKKKSMKEIKVYKGMYHVRAKVDDWEVGERIIASDELIRESGRIEVYRETLRYTEVIDPLTYGRTIH